MTQLLPGQLLYIFGASILDAALLSWLALLWYRRSVNRLMREARPDTAARRLPNSRTPRFLSGSAASPTEPGELILAEERPEALPHTAAQPRPGMVRSDRCVQRRRCRVRSRDYRLQVLDGVAAAAGRRVARRLVDEPVAGRSDARGAARARSSDRSAPRASLSARRRDRHLSVYRGRTASQRHPQHRAADEYLLGSSCASRGRHHSRSRSSP